MKIKVSDIFVDSDFNCRQEFTYQSVHDLSKSISEDGLISPLVVQPWGKDGFKWRLLVGHRRLKSINMFLRWKTVSAIINRKKLTSHQCRLLNVAENLERKDLNIWEEACALKHLYPTGTEITVAAMAAELKKPKAWILVRRRLLTMPEKIQKQAASGLLSQANLQDLFKMDSEEQLFAAEAIADARSKSGGHKHLRGLDSKYRSRRTAHRRPKINTMIEELFGLGVLGFPLRVAAWCAAQISDDELKDDAKQYVQKFKEQI